MNPLRIRLDARWTALVLPPVRAGGASVALLRDGGVVVEVDGPDDVTEYLRVLRAVCTARRIPSRVP